MGPAPVCAVLACHPPGQFGLVDGVAVGVHGVGLVEVCGYSGGEDGQEEGCEEGEVGEAEVFFCFTGWCFC